MYIRRDVEVEIDLDIREIAEEIYCASTEEQVKFFNLLAKKMLNEIKEIGWVSEDLKPETKEFLLKLCGENNVTK